MHSVGQVILSTLVLHTDSVFPFPRLAAITPQRRKFNSNSMDTSSTLYFFISQVLCYHHSNSISFNSNNTECWYNTFLPSFPTFVPTFLSFFLLFFLPSFLFVLSFIVIESSNNFNSNNTEYWYNTPLPIFRFFIYFLPPPLPFFKCNTTSTSTEY